MRVLVLRCHPGLGRRRVCHTAAALLFMFLFSSASADSTALTLEDSWRLAETSNPALRATVASLSAREGELRDARAPLWNNPEMSVAHHRREVPQVSDFTQINREWSIGLAQTFEIAGQQAERRAAAEQSLAASQQGITEARQQVHGEVERRFVRVLSLQLRIETEQATLKLIEDAAKAVSRRVAVGEDSRLDGNLARIEAERAHNQLALLREQLVEARTDLAMLLQLPANELPQVQGVLDRAAVSYSLEDLLKSSAQRPLLRSLQHREQAARSRLDLERAMRYPGVTVEFDSGREGVSDARETVVGLNVSMPLPLFRRNASGIGWASTELTQIEIERAATGRDVRAQVIALWERVTSLGARVQRLKTSVLPSLEENQHLSTLAFRTREIGLPQLLLVNRQLLEGQRDLLDARTDLRLTQVALEVTAGWQPASQRRGTR